MAGVSDTASELLIAQLLEEDLRVAEEARLLEHAQITQTLADSACFSGRIPRRALPINVSNDEEIALAMLAADVRLSSDAAYAQALQHLDDAASIASQQYAQRLLAAEKKITLDTEFARRLQQMEERGMDVDDPTTNDADQILGNGEIERILAENPNEKGKGKAANSSSHVVDAGHPDKQPKLEECDDLSNQSIRPVYPTCGICLEQFQLVHSPVNASKLHTTTSSTKLAFGLSIPCPGLHAYCQACLVNYIRSKVDPSHDGSGNPNTVVFPIRCPECPITTWEVGFTDDIAMRILTEKDMFIWHQQKLLDSLPRLYCPNKHCSALVQAHEDPDEPQAECPACKTLMCVPCRVLWHEGVSCEEYQALPLDERSPEDQQALQLMRAQNWRRCPECKVIVELIVGCNHITCRCGTHFCFKCGSKWDMKSYKCTRVPSCDNWDEEMLLEEQERRREANLAEPPQQAVDDWDAAPIHPEVAEVDDWGVPPIAGPLPRLWQRPERVAPPPYYAPPQIVRHNDAGDMHWMMGLNALNTRHWFTREMISQLACGYCDARLTSLADLRYHLSHTRRHDVFACCGRFFKREQDFEKHIHAKRFADHENQVHR